MTPGVRSRLSRLRRNSRRKNRPVRNQRRRRHPRRGPRKRRLLRRWRGKSPRRKSKRQPEVEPDEAGRAAAPRSNQAPEPRSPLAMSSSSVKHRSAGFFVLNTLKASVSKRSAAL